MAPPKRSPVHMGPSNLPHCYRSSSPSYFFTSDMSPYRCASRPSTPPCFAPSPFGFFSHQQHSRPSTSNPLHLPLLLPLSNTASTCQCFPLDPTTSLVLTAQTISCLTSLSRPTFALPLTFIYLPPLYSVSKLSHQTFSALPLKFVLRYSACEGLDNNWVIPITLTCLITF